ncbi:MAG: acylphosphatase [Thermoanaerobaculia bacterium]
MAPPGHRSGFLARVTGRVQGVGFRAFVRREGRRLGLSGEVRNLEDGSVEVRAAGSPEELEALLVRLGQGPPGARVARVERAPLAPPLPEGGFDISF